MHTQDNFRADLAVELGPLGPRHYVTQRGTGSEALEVRRRLGGFNAELSPVGPLLRQAFPGATKSELISVVQMTMIVAHERFPETFSFIGEFDRVTRRSMDLIIKWYHDNWTYVGQLFPDIGLADGNFCPISALAAFHRP
jgi:hypothetical protein